MKAHFGGGAVGHGLAGVVKQNGRHGHEATFVVVVPACDLHAVVGQEPVLFGQRQPNEVRVHAVDVAVACNELGIKSVAVTAGSICPEPRAEFYRHMDAANVDLKACRERFYRQICSAELQPVLETLMYLAEETDVWLEITNLIIPGENDSDGELDEMTCWVVEHLGPDVPLHFSAFHPDWKMLDKERTPHTTLTRARRIAMNNGVRYAYTGNVLDREGGTTRCSGCGWEVVVRDRYVLEALQSRGWGLGGEPSGHIVCQDKVTTGDGIVAALEVLHAMQFKGTPLSALITDLQCSPQAHANVPMSVAVAARTAVLREVAVRKILDEVEALLGVEGRVVVRCSGTEPVVRVMVEGQDQCQVQQYCEQIVTVISGLQIG